MNSPVNGLGNVTAADLVSRAAPSPAAHSGFEAVISDRGVDMAAAAGRARTESSSAATNPALSVDRASASQAPVPINGPSISAVSAQQSAESGSLAEVAVSSEVPEQSPPGTYNARGRSASPTQEAPTSRLLDIIG